jgi:hypothetical protein
VETLCRRRGTDSPTGLVLIVLFFSEQKQYKHAEFGISKSDGNHFDGCSDFILTISTELHLSKSLLVASRMSMSVFMSSMALICAVVLPYLRSSTVSFNYSVILLYPRLTFISRLEKTIEHPSLCACVQLNWVLVRFNVALNLSSFAEISQGTHFPLLNVQPEDRGWYRCVADNNVRPPSTYDCLVQVLFKPVVRAVQKTYGQAQNRMFEVTIECIVAGN